MWKFNKSLNDAGPTTAANTRNIVDLPNELLYRIFLHLDRTDVINSKFTCWRLYHFGNGHLKRFPRPRVRVDLGPMIRSGVPLLLTKFCRTNTQQGAPYLFSLCKMDGKIQLTWSKGGPHKTIVLNGTSESCNRIINKNLVPPAQIIKEFMEEVQTLDDAIRRMLRVHLHKVHIQELNFRSMSRPLLRSEIECLRSILIETGCEVERVYFGTLDPMYKEIANFTKCKELSIQAGTEKIDLLSLHQEKIMIYGTGAITVDMLIHFVQQWEQGLREIVEFRLMCELEVSEIKIRMSGLPSFQVEECACLLLNRLVDKQDLNVNIEHNSLRMVRAVHK